jgi:hypothetical protein
VSEAPVALFVYNRPELVARTLECLRAAGARRLYVFSEGPADDEDARRVEDVRARIRRLDWIEPVVTERERNLGWTASLQQGLDEVFAREERVVVLEDDIAVAPEFLDFVASALDRYANEPRVAAVTGLRLPFSRDPLRRYPYDAFLLPRFFSWSWATWRDRWETFELDGDRVLERLRRSRVPLETAGADLPWMVRSALVRGEVSDPWDVALSASLVLEGSYVVVPAWNMVENIGFATGLHGPDPAYELRWEAEHRPRGALRFPPPVPDPGMLRAFLVFRENPGPWRLRRLVPRPLRVLLRRLRRTYDPFR